MGISVIGGLLASLFLTFIVVPAAYDLLDDLKERVKRGRVSPKAKDDRENK